MMLAKTKFIDTVIHFKVQFVCFYFIAYCWNTPESHYHLYNLLAYLLLVHYIKVPLETDTYLLS